MKEPFIEFRVTGVIEVTRVPFSKCSSRALRRVVNGECETAEDTSDDGFSPWFLTLYAAILLAERGT